MLKTLHKLLCNYFAQQRALAGSIAAIFMILPVVMGALLAVKIFAKHQYTTEKQNELDTITMQAAQHLANETASVSEIISNIKKMSTDIFAVDCRTSAQKLKCIYKDDDIKVEYMCRSKDPNREGEWLRPIASTTRCNDGQAEVVRITRKIKEWDELTEAQKKAIPLHIYEAMPKKIVSTAQLYMPKVELNFLVDTSISMGFSVTKPRKLPVLLAGGNPGCIFACHEESGTIIKHPLNPEPTGIVSDWINNGFIDKYVPMRASFDNPYWTPVAPIKFYILRRNQRVGDTFGDTSDEGVTYAEFKQDRRIIGMRKYDSNYDLWKALAGKDENNPGDPLLVDEAIKNINTILDVFRRKNIYYRVNIFTFGNQYIGSMYSTAVKQPAYKVAALLNGTAHVDLESYSSSFGSALNSFYSQIRDKPRDIDRQMAVFISDGTQIHSSTAFDQDSQKNQGSQKGQCGQFKDAGIPLSTIHLDKNMWYWMRQHSPERKQKNSHMLCNKDPDVYAIYRDLDNEDSDALGSPNNPDILAAECSPHSNIWFAGGFGEPAATGYSRADSRKTLSQCAKEGGGAFIKTKNLNQLDPSSSGATVSKDLEQKFRQFADGISAELKQISLIPND